MGLFDGFMGLFPGGGPVGGNTFDPQTTGVGGFFNDISGATGQNNFSAGQARQAEQWTKENMSTQYAYDVDMYERMKTDAGTAHQREVADLKAAGLNPILSGMGGSGASTPQGNTPNNPSGPQASGTSPGIGGVASMASSIFGGAASLAKFGLDKVNSAKDRENTTSQIALTKQKTLTEALNTAAAAQSLRSSSATADQDEIDAEIAKSNKEIRKQSDFNQKAADKVAGERDASYNARDRDSGFMGWLLNRVFGHASSSASNLSNAYRNMRSK